MKYYKNDQIFHMYFFYFWISGVWRQENAIVPIIVRKHLIFKKKWHIWKNWSIFNILVIFQLILKVLYFFKWSNLSIYIDKKFKSQQNIQFFWRFLVPKIVFWKKHYWVATTTDCFEPIFVFLRQFCFEKHRSATWSRMGMFSELSGRSEIVPTTRKWPWKRGHF